MTAGDHAEERDSRTGQFLPPSAATAGPGGLSRLRRPGPTVRAVAAIALACYLSALLAVNLVGNPVFNNTPLSALAVHLFPRVGTPSNQIDTASVQAEWDVIQENYFIRGVSGSKGTQGAEAGMITQLQSEFHDRWTMLLSKAEYDAAFGEPLSGERSGSIGISVDLRCAKGAVCPSGQTPTEVMITDVLVNQPAAKAGLKRGDVIVAVAGTTVASLGTLGDATVTKLASLIRGAAGTTVSITVQRDGQALTLTPTRQNLSIPSVFATKMGGVLYLQVTDFGSDTGSLVTSTVQKYAAGTTGIILDLRENGGGYVDATSPLVSQFVAPSSSAQDVVVRRGRMDRVDDPGSAQVIERDALKSGGLLTQTGIPMVVLVNADTASAAEICTEALRDYHRATIVGEKTLGKGSVQTNFTLPDGNVLHLTIERWYGPNGESIDGTGITPDYVVALDSPDDRFRLDAESVAPTQDAQLEQALKVLHAG